MFQFNIPEAKNSCQTNHAPVIGGGIAGLLAAQILTKYFDRVTIIERDSLGEQPRQRQGVPQARHVHVLLKHGQQILEQIFPGIEADLSEAGVPIIDWTADLLWFGSSGLAPRFTSGLTTFTCSRNLLEWSIRGRLATNASVIFMQAARVTNLLTDINKVSVDGIRVQLHDKSQLDLIGDFVIDASGRNSCTPKWLIEIGYTSPSETIVDSFSGYASRWYQCPDDLKSDWQCLYVAAKPPSTRSAVIYPVENDRWVVTLAGAGRDYPSIDDAGFLEFAKSLHSPAIFEAIKDAKPISEAYSYKGMANRLRHYEKLSKFPERFVVIGDAVCAFNPVYGQGMTVAASAALILDQCLSQQLSKCSNRSLTGLSRIFQKRLSKVIAKSWRMTTGEDFRWPTTEGKRPDLIARLTQFYVDQILLLSAENKYIHKCFLEVMHQLKPFSSFFHPRISIQVLKQVIALQTKK